MMKKYLMILTLSACHSVSHANPAPINTHLPIDRVLSVVTTDWNEDGLQDRAILIASDDSSADLYIFESSDTDQQSPKALKVYKQGIAWMGGMWGTQPELKLSGRNSLQIVSQNDAIGRDRWNETITVTRRDGDYRVVGYTYNSRDTLDPDAFHSCDINLLNGKAVIDGKAQKHTLKTVRLADWSSTPPELCQPN